jgi:hypothetical protein
MVGAQRGMTVLQPFNGSMQPGDLSDSSDCSMSHMQHHVDSRANYRWCTTVCFYQAAYSGSNAQQVALLYVDGLHVTRYRTMYTRTTATSTSEFRLLPSFVGTRWTGAQS